MRLASQRPNAPSTGITRLLEANAVTPVAARTRQSALHHDDTSHAGAGDVGASLAHSGDGDGSVNEDPSQARTTTALAGVDDGAQERVPELAERDTV